MKLRQTLQRRAGRQPRRGSAGLGSGEPCCPHGRSLRHITGTSLLGRSRLAVMAPFTKPPALRGRGRGRGRAQGRGRGRGRNLPIAVRGRRSTAHRQGGHSPPGLPQPPGSQGAGATRRAGASASGGRSSVSPALVAAFSRLAGGRRCWGRPGRAARPGRSRPGQAR